MRFRFPIVILLFCIQSSCVEAQFTFTSSDPSQVGMSPDSLDKMNTHLHNLVDAKQLAGIQTAIIKNGKLVQFDSYGFADIENSIPLDENSIFRIFSMTKPIVSVALMQLFEQGKFTLDDPLSKYIPAFKTMYVLEDTVKRIAKNQILIKDLLRHSSGFNYGRSNNPILRQAYTDAELWAAKDNKEYLEKLSTIPLQFEPGTDWQYGLSTNICGHLIELLSDKSLDTYLKDNIFDPLNMENTYFKLPAEKLDQFTVGYRWSEGDSLIIAETPEESRFLQKVNVYNGGGGLLSTTHDYLNFCQMILNGGILNDKRILKKETLELMFMDQLAEVRTHRDSISVIAHEASFGLGFAIRGDHPSSLQKIYGWGGAVGTYFKLDVENNLAYVMMIQLSPHRQLDLRYLFHNYVQAAVI